MLTSSTAIARRTRNTFSIMGHNPALVAISLAAQLAGPFAKTKPSFLGITRAGDRRHPQPSWAPCPPATNGNFSALLGAPTGQVDALGRPIISGAIYNPFSTRQITAGQVDPTTGLTASKSG